MNTFSRKLAKGARGSVLGTVNLFDFFLQLCSQNIDMYE